MRYLVTDGYRHIAKPNRIIITNVFSQASMHVSRKIWRRVIGSNLPHIRNDVTISNEEIKALKE